MPTPEQHIAPAGLRLDQVVAHWAAVWPERYVLRGVDSEQLSWRDFEAAVARAAAALSDTIVRGEAVAVECFNEAPFHVLVNALWRIGAGVLLLDRNWGPAIVNDLLGLVGCTKVFSHDKGSLHTLPGAERLPYPALDTRAGAPPLPAASAPGIDQVAIYATTSGTTDNPKCVAITHRQLRSAYRSCLAVHDFSRVERCGCLFDINSLGVLGVCFLLPREVGAGTLLFPSFSLANVRPSWEAVLGVDGVDFVYLVPPLVRLINTLPPWQERQRGSVLAFCSAAPVAERELRALEERFPVQVFNCYGLTELCFAVFFGARDGGLASDTIGPARGIDARLVDDDGNLLDGPGEGELWITGPMKTGFYLHNERATRESWVDGWLRTGDIAERDALDRYTIRGRKKDMVLRGGYTYYLHELEHYLRRAPGVIDACAFKGRDLPSGDELCVMVQAERSVEAAALLSWIRDSLGVNKVPNVLLVCRHGLPRNSNGKVLRPALARMHLDGTLTQWAAG